MQVSYNVLKCLTFYFRFQQIRDKIEEVREHELSLDELDNETSDYIFEDKLKKKFVTVFKKLCQLHKTEATTGRPTEKFFRYEGNAKGMKKEANVS